MLFFFTFLFSPLLTFKCSPSKQKSNATQIADPQNEVLSFHVNLQTSSGFHIVSFQKALLQQLPKTGFLIAGRFDHGSVCPEYAKKCDFLVVSQPKKRYPHPPSLTPPQINKPKKGIFKTSIWIPPVQGTQVLSKLSLLVLSRA